MAQQKPINFVHDLDFPIVGSVVREPVYLLFGYAAIAAWVLTTPLGAISAVGVLLLGASDIKATTRENEPRALTGTSARTALKPGSGGEATESVTESHNKDSSLPWDDEYGDAQAVTEDELAATGDPVTRDWHNKVIPLDKLKGVGLAEFKQKYGNHIEGSTQSPQLIGVGWGDHLIDARIKRFWFEFGSTKMDCAVFYVFGVTKGGSQGTAKRQRYDDCAERIQDWFDENLGDGQ